MQYLGKWSVEEKSTSRNPASPEFKQRLEYFIDSCMKIHDWNTYNKYPMEFTFYADWHPEEFEKLASTSQRYSGIKTPVPATVPTYNNSNLRYLLPSLDPCDDIIEGGNTLRSTISKPQSCSVSWAFAVTNSIEYAIKKFYLEEFNQEISVALSAQELIDCVGKEHGLEDACEGMPIAWGFDYAFENGIAYRQYYPHTNIEGECQDIPDEHKYHIAGYEKPHVYNKLGLFEMLQKGPVAVTLGLDPEYFQYYQSDRQNGPYFDTAFWKPSVYGVVIEYNQYEEEGKEGYSEWPFFAIETRLRACDSMIFRLPIRSTLSDANIAGIAGFAIRPLVMETIPFYQSLVVTKEEDCGLLSQTHWQSIVVEQGLCNSLTGNLTISAYPHLQSITIKEESLNNLQSLTIANNPLLTHININEVSCKNIINLYINSIFDSII